MHLGFSKLTFLEGYCYVLLLCLPPLEAILVFPMSLTRINKSRDSNRHRKAYKQDVFELEVRSGLSSTGFCGGIYGDCWLKMVTIPCFWPYYVPQQVIMWGVLIPDSEGCLNAGYYYWFLQTVFFASSQSLLCALHLLDKGISWLNPLITLFFKDGHGDKVVCILEIRNFGLAMLYHIKN